MQEAEHIREVAHAAAERSTRGSDCACRLVFLVGRLEAREALLQPQHRLGRYRVEIKVGRQRPTMAKSVTSAQLGPSLSPAPNSSQVRQ